MYCNYPRKTFDKYLHDTLDNGKHYAIFFKEHANGIYAIFMSKNRLYYYEGCPVLKVIDDSKWYIEELNKTKREIEEVFKKERFNVQLIKSMNNKGLFTDYRKGQAKNIIDNFYKAKEIYETRYQTFSPELLVKEYKIKQKLKRLQGDF